MKKIYKIMAAFFVFLLCAVSAFAAGDWSVTLDECGPQKIAVIKVVRNANGMSLKDSKALVESTPKVVKDKLSEAEADKLVKELVAAGAKASKKGPAGTSSTASSSSSSRGWSVTLDSIDSTKKIAIIKAVRAATGLGLADSKALVESTPKLVKDGLTEADANKLVADLNAAGGKASKKAPAGASTGTVATATAQASSGGSVSGKFVRVDGGTFTMGLKGGDADEATLHKVTVGTFSIGTTEVTQKQWKDIMGWDDSRGNYNGDEFPMVKVSWFDALEFCNALSKKDGLKPCYEKDGDNWIWKRDANGYRLPTEAEWEFAARGGNKSKGYKFSGSNDAGEVAWHIGTADEYLRKVALLKPNELGIYDMCGNVCEWCWDYWGKLSYTAAPQDNPTGLSKGQNGRRLYRGGDVTDAVEKCILGHRACNDPGKLVGTIGFRLVKGELPKRTEYVLVQGGTFQMGGETNDGDATPVHTVTISPFYIGTTEVTQAQYKALMGKNPSSHKGADDLPVEKVTWNDAAEYCNALSKKDGLTPCYKNSKSGYICDFTANGWRLPTEAEWEFAARGGGKENFKFSGSNDSTEVGWITANSKCTRSVATLKPNALGLYDMTGNVREWCWDWWDKQSYTKHDPKDPKGVPNGTRRVNRGGDWGSDGSADWGFGYVFERYSTKPAECGSDVGFRVVRNAK